MSINATMNEANRQSVEAFRDVKVRTFVGEGWLADLATSLPPEVASWQANL